MLSLIWKFHEICFDKLVDIAVHHSIDIAGLVVGTVVFDAAGRMVASSWHLDGDTYYYLGEDGGMLSSQWLQYHDSWYYLGRDGAMAADCYVPDPRGWCYVDKYGQWDGVYCERLPVGPGVRAVDNQEH